MLPEPYKVQRCPALDDLQDGLRIRKNLKGKREIETVGLPFRAAISECSRGNNRQGLPKGAFNFLRQINDEEVSSRDRGSLRRTHQ